ncbi:YeeE/YedE family protein [Vulgatibacter incomptus]|uniref:Putative transmembrane protein n=1 Tax=Vulgatibacter incomptus TaxID=1391653 RepID=A0A0K1PFY7_9BACT|nr:YeeE/YedE family protein [Vulgatibacter incomptus]AKU92448.1 putative transmembrane protein [Vulgatibacter incomptus]
MDWISIKWALGGGVLIGVSASLLLLFNGRVAGISGILGGLVSRQPGKIWRALFVAGLVVGGAVAYAAMPGRFDASAAPSLPLVAIAGALVGIGTRLGSGCTSGHGVCGISRLSPRSIVATLTFMATGALSVLVVRLVGGLE